LLLLLLPLDLLVLLLLPCLSQQAPDHSGT
jgi:hypothetical protein